VGPPLPPPSVSITATRLVIYGSIIEDLEIIVKTMPSSIRLVVLDSPGGMSDPADRIAKEFRRRGVTAYVPNGGSCFSACAVMLAGAATRLVHPSAEVMVHAQTMLDGSDTRRTRFFLNRKNAETARQLAAWGVDAEFAMNALKLPRETHERFLNARSALRVGLATAIATLPEADAATRLTCSLPPLGTAIRSPRQNPDAYRIPPPGRIRVDRRCSSWQPSAP
jgi:ATP-dependent protease ClpP protease subunit